MTTVVNKAPSAPAASGRFSGPPSLRLQRGFALAAIITNAMIAVTGAVVRVTGSGLGCPTWPECHPGSLIPQDREEYSAFHQAIEFGNRTLTGVVLFASLGTFLLIWRARPRRKSLIRVALILPVVVIFQAVWGGLTVLTGLAWWTVAPHMLVSLLLVFAAVWIHGRLGEPDGPVKLAVPKPLVTLVWATVGVLLALCIVGTLVTAAGPHAGDVDTPRLDLSVRALAQVHADLMFLYLGLIVALGVAVVALKGSAHLRKRLWVLVGVTMAQGLVGLVQFATGVPEALVIAHVLGATLLIIAAARVAFATRTRVALS